MIGVCIKRDTPEPGFEPESEAPQASRISKLPHSGLGANTTVPAMVEHSDANYFFVSAFIIYQVDSNCLIPTFIHWIL